MEKSRNKSHYVYFAAISVNFLSIAAGLAFAWPSPFIPKLNGSVEPENNPLSEPTTLIQDSWIASLQMLGALSGPLFASTIIKWIGKKNMLLLFNIPFIVANIMIYFASTITEFYVARFLLGTGTGCVYSFVPIYVAEISEVHDRGITSMMLALLLSGSQLFTYIIGPYVSIKTFAIICLVPSVLFIITFGLCVPESPYQLVLSNKIPEAEKALIKLRRKKNVEKELSEISKDIEDSMGKVSLLSLLKSQHIRKCMKVAVGLTLFQQATGLMPILYYQQSIFDSTHGPISGEKSAMLVGLIQHLTIVMVTFVINRVGRKKLMFYSNLGQTIVLVILGAYFFFDSRHYDMSSYSWIPVVGICAFMVFFNIGAGPITWTILGEIFPSNLKSYLSSFSVFILLLFGFLISFAFPSMSVYIGMAGSMWFFACFAFAAVLYSMFILVETKDKSFTEIQKMFEGSVK